MSESGVRRVTIRERSHTHPIRSRAPEGATPGSRRRSSHPVGHARFDEGVEWQELCARVPVRPTGDGHAEHGPVSTPQSGAHPFRPHKSTKQHREIWTDTTSPLLRHTVELTDAVQEHRGSEYLVTLRMRYKNPSLAVARPLPDNFAPEHVLFSYHGVLERHIRKRDSVGAPQIDAPGSINVNCRNRFCSRTQCYATTSGYVDVLDLPTDSYSTPFRLPMAAQKWIRPTRTIPSRVFEIRGYEGLRCASVVWD